MLLRELVFRISPDGKQVVSLYSDALNLLKHGQAQVVRATDVFFDEEVQKWRVNVFGAGILKEAFGRREDAIAYETEVLNRLLLGKKNARCRRGGSDNGR